MPYSIYKLQNQIAKASHNYGVTLHLKNILHSTNYKLIYYTLSHFFFNIFVFTFDIALVYRVTNTFWSIAVYHYFIHIVLLLTYLFFYNLKTKIKVHDLFRLSIFITILTFFYLISMFSNIHSLNILYGYFFLRSMAVGVFFLGFHTAFLYGLNDKNRDEFSLLLFSVYSLLPVFLPFIGGYIIDYSGLTFLPSNVLLPDGYFILYIISLVIAVFMLIFSPVLDIYLDTTKGVKKALKLLFNKELRDVINYQIYDSFSVSIRVVVYGLIAFLILINEFNLGFFTSLIALFGSIYFLFIRHIEKQKNIKRIKFFAVGIIADIFSQIFLLFSLNLVGLLVRAVSNTAAGPLKRIGAENTLRSKYDEYSKKYNINKSHFILLHEVAYTIGRTLAIILFVILVFVFNITDVFNVFKILLSLFILLDLTEYFIIKRISK